MIMIYTNFSFSFFLVFGFFILWHINIRGLFTAKAIFAVQIFNQ